MSFRVKWWQLFFYEIAVLSLGIVIGAHWHGFFENILYPLLLVFLFAGGYVLYALTKQIEDV